MVLPNIHLYAWEASLTLCNTVLYLFIGLTAGLTYTALDRDLDPQIPVYKFTKDNVPPKGNFLDPTGSYIPTAAEFECILRIGDGQVIPGLDFEEDQIRPPLYVPRPEDDFVDGEPPEYAILRATGGLGVGNKGKNGKSGASSLTLSLGVLVGMVGAMVGIMMG